MRFPCLQIEDAVLAPFAGVLGVASSRQLQDKLEQEAARRNAEIAESNSKQVTLQEHLQYDRKRADEARKAIKELTKLRQVAVTI